MVVFFLSAPAEVRIAVALALQRHGGGSLEKFAKVAPADKAEPEGGSAVAGAGAGAAAGAGAGGADAEGLQQYVRQLQDTFLQSAGPDVAEGGDGSSQQRQWAIEQLCSVLKQAAAPVGVKQEVLQFLAVHALFSVNAAAAKKVGWRWAEPGCLHPACCHTAGCACWVFGLHLPP